MEKWRPHPLKQPSEHEEQKAVVNWLRKRGIFVYAIPNGGLRDAITAKRLRDEGALSGIPDLQIVLNNGKVIWLEMKTRKDGVLSNSQRTIHETLLHMGHLVLIGHGAKDAIELLKMEMEELT